MKIIIVLLLSSLLSCNGRKPLYIALKGKTIPTFNLLLPDSTTYFNTSNIPIGKPFVLFYFSPQCTFCRAELEEVINNINLLKDINFYILTPFPFQEMKDFYDEYQIKKYPNITMGRDYTFFFGKYFDTQSVPYLAIYGKDRRLKESFNSKIGFSKIKEIAEK